MITFKAVTGGLTANNPADKLGKVVLSNSLPDNIDEAKCDVLVSEPK
ncbi:MAG TPA: hypothetical protein PLW14_13260 [Chlorobiota bacterium]|nr:hypothetical protein [Chlorobiota bacterium]